MGAYQGLTDAELVEKTLHGDSGAYCEIVSRYKNAVFSAATGIISDRFAAEDVAQEAFIDGYLKLGDLREREKAGAWLCGIARRKALHLVCRRRECEDIDDFSETLATGNTSPEDELLRKEDARAVRNALERLPEKSRETARLYYLRGKTVAEISESLAAPEGTVRRRLHDAREKLKGELSYMNENILALPPDFEKKVREKIDALKHYYALNGESYDGFDTVFAEAESMAARIPDETGKQSALAELYLLSHWKNGGDETAKDRAKKAAEAGKNADVLCSLFIDEIVVGEDYAKWIRKTDEEAIPKMEELGYKNGKGMLLFWRGRAELGLKNTERARENFAEAARLTDKSNIYHAAAVCALKSANYMAENAEDPSAVFNVTAESYMKDSTKLRFASQPGFGGETVMSERHKLDYLNYFVSRFDSVFYDFAMEVGRTYTSKNGGATLTLVAADETVTVAAGTFEHCMRMRYSCPAEYDADVWYAKDVGLIKVNFSGNWATEEYELKAYDIKGGSGYMPFCEGNRWEYVKPDLPEYLYQRYEYEIDWTDGKTANFSAVRLVTYKKNYLSLYEGTLDSDAYIDRCKRLCDEWKLGEAIEALRCAVRKNSTQNATGIALAGIDYLTRFKAYKDKGYRFCPSSMNGSYLTAKDGVVIYDESGAYSFEPYRWGSRYAENRIFGVKPFRYLQDLFGRVYDEKWVNGYSETKTAEDGVSARLEVSGGGTVETPAGRFENCLKVTISAEASGAAPDYYFKGYRHVWCGVKEFWFAPGVGIVKFDYTWGDNLKSSSELVSYSAPAGGEGYMPVYIGSRLEYDEVNLTAEGYRAKRIISVLGGVGGKYLIADAQEFLYLGTEEEYKAFKANAEKK